MMSMAFGDIDGPIPPDLSHLRHTYLGLNIAGGHVGLPIIIATCFLSKNTVKHPTIINLLCTWTLYSICNCLTSYTGKAQTASYKLCHLQSAILHGVYPMCATACLIVVLQIWWMFRQPELAHNTSANRTLPTSMLAKLALPYVIFLGYTILTAALQFKHPSYVHAANGLYCSYYKNPFRRFGTATYSIVCVILILGFEVAIAIRYFYMAHQISSGFPLADSRKISPMVIIRLTLFTVYCIISFGAGIFFVSSLQLAAWPFMVQAGVPLLIALVFGGSKEIYTCWCFTKKKRKAEHEGNNSGMNSSERVVCSSDLLIRTPVPSIGVVEVDRASV